MTRFAAWLLGSWVCGMTLGCGGRDSELDADAGTWVIDPGTADGGFTPSPTHRYRVSRSAANTVLAPLPDPTSFTFDGHDYWFLFGTETWRGGRVVEVDPATSAILRDWSVPPLLTDSPDAVFGGVAWDGEAVWIGTSGAGAAVFRITKDGLAEKGWKVQMGAGANALAFDGKRLWVSSGLGDMDAIDPQDGRLQASFLVNEHNARQAGIAYRGDELWVSALLGGLDVYDPTRGTRWNSVESVPDGELLLNQIAFVGPRLASLQGSHVVLYEIEARR